jgi:predicted MFS family arabinose efflux permease
MSRKELSLLIILAFINFTNIMDFMIMLPLEPFLEKSFHITTVQFGFLVSVYGFSACAASMTASFFVDRFNRKHVLLIAFSGLILGTFGCGIANSYETLMASRIVAGLFGGLIGAQALAIVGDSFSYERRGRAMGFLFVGFVMATIAGVPVGLYLATKSTWQMPFIGIGTLGVILWVLSSMLIPDLKGHINRHEERNVFRVYQSVWKNRNQQMALLMMMTLMFSHFVTMTFLPTYLTRNTGFLQEQLSWMYFSGGIASLFVTPLAGKLSDKFGKHKIFTISMLVAFIPIYLVTHLGHVPFYHVLLITSLFFIVGSGRGVPAQALVTSVVPADMRGGFMNLNSSLQFLSMALASFLGGLIVTKNVLGELQHYQIVGYISIAVGLICLFLAQKVKAVDMQSVDKL